LWIQTASGQEALAVLYGTGLVWWWLPEGTSLRVYLIALHGLAAMLVLMILGGVAIVHACKLAARSQSLERWIHGRHNQRVSADGFGLYYLGSDCWRDVAYVHLIVGAFAPLMVAVHVIVGARSRSYSEEIEERDVDTIGAFAGSTFLCRLCQKVNSTEAYQENWLVASAF
jgi:hypothetical protein